MMDIYHEDDCCGVALAEALLQGDLDTTDSWTHEKCGVEWRAQMEVDGLIRQWTPFCSVEIFQ